MGLGINISVQTVDRFFNAFLDKILEYFGRGQNIDKVRLGYQLQQAVTLEKTSL